MLQVDSKHDYFVEKSICMQVWMTSQCTSRIGVRMEIDESDLAWRRFFFFWSEAWRRLGVVFWVPDQGLLHPTVWGLGTPFNFFWASNFLTFVQSLLSRFPISLTFFRLNSWIKLIMSRRQSIKAVTRCTTYVHPQLWSCRQTKPTKMSHDLSVQNIMINSDYYYY